MHPFALTPGQLLDAEVAYRREQVATEVRLARRRGPVRWWPRRRAAHRPDGLTLAA